MRTAIRGYRRVVAIAALSLSTTLAAQAADEDEAVLPEAGETPAPPKVDPPAAPATVAEAPAPSALFMENLGPESYPGRSRGLAGGSLWLEPTFHGLQWPQNARTGLGISGRFWIDSGYQKIKRDIAASPDSTMSFQQGRGIVRLTPAFVRDGFFVQGQAELVGNLCQTANRANEVCNAGTFSTDDLWVRVGRWNSWDVKVGRFQGWEIAHLGLGLDPNTFERQGAHMLGADWPAPSTPRYKVPELYGVSYLQDRPADGLAVGYAAVHAYISDALRFELLGKLGTDKQAKGEPSEDVPSTYRGGRLAAIYDLGWLRLKAGGEYQTRVPTMQVVDVQTAQKKDPVEELVQKGAGVSVQFVFDPLIEFGANAARGIQSYTDATGNAFNSADSLVRSFTTTTVGGFANLRVADGILAGVGVNWTMHEDEYRADNSSANDYTTHLQGFAALQYQVAGQLYLKAVLAYAGAKFQPSDTNDPVWNSTMLSGRVRLMYLY